MADATVAAPATQTTLTNSAPVQNNVSAPPTPQLKESGSQLHKIKVDGQEFELPLSEILSLAQQGKGAAKRFQEAATTRREAEQIIQFSKENPKEFFNKTGMNARQWAEDYLMQEIQLEAMSPEQKKARDNEERLKKYEDGEKSAKEKAHQEEMAALERQHMENYDKMFVEALTQSGLPRTPFTVMRMAQLTLSAEKNKIPVNAAQIAKLVREDYISEQKALFGAADGDQILEMLGKDVVKKLSKAQLAKYKSNKVNNSATQAKPVEPKKLGASQVESWKAFQKRNRTGF